MAPELRDSALFWLALGGVVATIGAIPMAAIGKMEVASPWKSWYFRVGFGMAAVGMLALIWALVLFVAHRHVQSHVASPQPTVPGPTERLPLATKPTATSEELASRHISDRTLRIADLAEGGPPTISGRVIENCELRGPAVLVIEPGTTISGVHFLDPSEGFLYEIEPPRPLFGVIIVEDTVIRQCTITGVGIMGDRAFLNYFRERVTNPDEQ